MFKKCDFSAFDLTEICSFCRKRNQVVWCSKNAILVPCSSRLERSSRSAVVLFSCSKIQSSSSLVSRIYRLSSSPLQILLVFSPPGNKFVSYSKNYIHSNAHLGVNVLHVLKNVQALQLSWFSCSQPSVLLQLPREFGCEILCEFSRFFHLLETNLFDAQRTRF